MASREGTRFYGYKRWTTEERPRCFYVGKGRLSRVASHCNRSHKWYAIVKRYGLRIEICVGPITNEEACAWEVEHIRLERTYTRCHEHDNPNEITCNFTYGGDGSNGAKPMLGRRHSDESREKMRLSALGRKNSRAPSSGF